MKNVNHKIIRTRFAPSPTGSLHIGGLRTALFSYLIAKKNDGKFVLRIEDTDRKRAVEGAVEKIVNALSWAGITPDEGVVGISEDKLKQSGEYGPYIQSERLDIYQQHSEILLEKGHAYRCFCSQERLKSIREQQQKNGQPPMYDKKCLSLSREEIQEKMNSGEQYTVRLKVPTGELVEFEDGVYGKISVKSDTIDDQVLVKSDGYPTYHLAVVVDDHLMEISHVTRGEEWLPSTPKHILLYRSFGWDLPQFVHFPSVQGEDRKKLSKRQSDVSVEDFIANGYLPEALINFLALLGWNPKSQQEYFTLPELKKIFNVKGLHKAGAVFDYKKLNWMNAHYIKQKSDDELLKLCMPYFNRYSNDSENKPGPDALKKIVHIEKARMKTLPEIADNIDFYFTAPDPEKNILKWKQMADEDLVSSLQKSKEALEEIAEDDFVVKKLEEKLLAIAGSNKGELLWPLRVSLSGKEQSPSPFEIAWTIGKKEALSRITHALKKAGA